MDKYFNESNIKLKEENKIKKEIEDKFKNKIKNDYDTYINKSFLFYLEKNISKLENKIINILNQIKNNGNGLLKEIISKNNSGIKIIENINILMELKKSSSVLGFTPQTFDEWKETEQIDI